MKRSQYEYRMSREQVAAAVERLESFSEMLKTASEAMALFPQTGKETLRVRDAVSRSKLPLDFSEFLKHVRDVSPQAADALGRAEVIRFELGRLKLQFETGTDRLNFSWHKHVLEQLSEKLYKLPLKITSRADYPNS